MSGWTAIVVAKPWHAAKSRLDAPHRASLARAFTLDVLEAVTASDLVERVVVVSAERGLVPETRRRGVALVVDWPAVATGGLNTAVNHGWRWARLTAPGSPVVVIPADLPSLEPRLLDEALARLGEHDLAFVPDADDVGTTLLSASVPDGLRSAYGPGSAARHERLGLTRVTGAPLAARRDVDTLDDLAAAVEIGVGPHTATVLQDHDARARTA